MTRLVEAFKGQPRAESAVANHRHDFSRRSFQGFRFHHSQGCGYGRPGVARAKHVIFAFLSAQETTDATQLTDGCETLASAANELVRVRLVSGVPDDAIFGGFKHVMKSQRQLYRAERRGQMTTDFRYYGDDLFPDLRSQLRKLVYSQLANVSGIFDTIKQTRN